jgi:hypothetical protein
MRDASIKDYERKNRMINNLKIPVKTASFRDDMYLKSACHSTPQVSDLIQQLKCQGSARQVHAKVALQVNGCFDSSQTGHRELPVLDITANGIEYALIYQQGDGLNFYGATST